MIAQARMGMGTMCDDVPVLAFVALASVVACRDETAVGPMCMGSRWILFPIARVRVADDCIARSPRAARAADGGGGAVAADDEDRDERGAGDEAADVREVRDAA